MLFDANVVSLVNVKYLGRFELLTRSDCPWHRNIVKLDMSPISP